MPIIMKMPETKRQKENDKTYMITKTTRSAASLKGHNVC